MPTKTFIILMLISSLLLDCTGSNTPTEPKVAELTSLQKSLLQSENQFGLKLFQRIAESKKDSNVFISPLSVSMALGMTLNGANGKTYEDMRNTLEFQELTSQQINESYQHILAFMTGIDPKVQLQLANSIWCRQGYPVEAAFKEVNQKYFSALVSELDFSQPSAVETMNHWIETNTNGLIKDMLTGPIDPLVMLYLINTIYFKGTWTYQFDEKFTTDADFYLENGSKQPCRLMTQTNDFLYFADSKLQIIDLPYGDGSFSMTIFTPTAGIADLVATLTPEKWAQWLGNLKKQKGTLLLPRFKWEYKSLLNDALKAMGMAIAFSGSADFKRINPLGDLYISRVLHNSFVEVNEEGTEAAAATVVELREKSGGNDGFTLRLDRPFIFAIRENSSGTILFIGQFMMPEI